MDISLIPKEVMLAWGIPGTLLLIAVGIIIYLFRSLKESYEGRVAEAISMVTKYEDTLTKVQLSLDAVIDLLKERENGK